ncbi:hypothetical protein LJC36_05505 [Desulfovibrio sp. OttesenSCG-928-C14]|nr:hypothetical protein [Desulfovibrio sp. OttesenSCG-928-C14]
MTSQQNLITVRGYIVSLPRKDGKEDAKVTVQAEDGVEYYIVPKGMGMDLVEHINAGVELSGLLQEQDERKFILVRQYQINDQFEDEWYDDDTE